MMTFALGFLCGVIVILLFAHGFLQHIQNKLDAAIAAYGRAIKLHEKTMENLE